MRRADNWLRRWASTKPFAQLLLALKDLKLLTTRRLLLRYDGVKSRSLRYSYVIVI